MDVLLLLLKVTALLVFALAGAWLLRQTSAAVRHALWTATFVGVLALPLLSWMVPAIDVPVATEGHVPALTHADLFDPSEMAVEENAGTAVAPPAAAGTSIPAVRPDVGSRAEAAAVESAGRSAMAPRWPRPTLGGVVLGVWLTGFIAALAAIVVSLVRVRRLAAVAEEVLDPEWQAALAETSTSFGRRPARLMMSASVAVPMAGGVWRPTIFLPADALKWPIDQRAAVLAHETAHLAAWDPLRHLVARVALAVYWFHPLAWLAVRQGSADCEQACDQAVVVCGVLPSTYARVLLALAESTMPGRQALAALPIVSSSRLERRLMAILDDEARRPRRGLALTMAVAVLLAAGAVGPLGPVSVAQPEVERPQAPVIAPLVNTTPRPARQTAASGAPSAGVISGRVLDALSGSPIPDAAVELWPADDRPMPLRGTPRTADAGGRFEFAGLEVGQYQVEATSSGYLPGAWGKEGPVDACCEKVILRTAERFTNVDIRLWPGASMSGTVTDERAEPLVGVTVSFLRRDFMDGRWAWTTSGAARTDDRGHFASRLGLRPGDYLVVLPSLQPRARADQPSRETVYYGAARLASDATVIRLAAGERRLDIDLVSAAPTPGTLSVAGRVLANGQPLSRATVELIRRDAEGAVAHLDGFRMVTDSAGRFTFSNVLAGEYRLHAWQFPQSRMGATVERTGPGGTVGTGFRRGSASVGPSDDPTWVADVPVSVERAISGLDVRAETAPRITGRVVVAGRSSPPTAEVLGRMRLDILTAHGRDLGRVPVGGFEPDGRFQTVGLPPGQYLLAPGVAGAIPPGPYYRLISMRVDAREVPGGAVALGTKDLDVVLTLTDQLWELSGTARNLDGRAVPGARVIIFPRDRADWLRPAMGTGQIHRVAVDRFGAFTLKGRLPGDYLVAAVTSPPEFWMAPEYLETLVSIATPVRIELAEKQSIDLRLRP